MSYLDRHLFKIHFPKLNNTLDMMVIRKLNNYPRFFIVAYWLSKKVFGLPILNEYLGRMT